MSIARSRWTLAGLVWLGLCGLLAIRVITEFPPVGASYRPVPTMTSLAAGVSLLVYAFMGLVGLIACLFAARQSQGR